MSDANTPYQTVATTAREAQRAARRNRRAWLRESPVDIRSFYKDTLGVQNDEVLDLYTRNTNYVVRNKGEVFVRAGEPSTILRFILKGVSRGYVLDDQGVDRIMRFGYYYGEPLLGAPTLSSRTVLFMEAVTDMEVLEIPVPVLMEGIAMEPSNAEVYEKLLEVDHLKQTKTQIALNTLNGEDRYLWFLEEYADIADIVPQNFIASFLGIQPQSLSRIKRQLREQREETP